MTPPASQGFGSTGLIRLAKAALAAEVVLERYHSSGACGLLVLLICVAAKNVIRIVANGVRRPRPGLRRQSIGTAVLRRRGRL